jgi:hypothetical protein
MVSGSVGSLRGTDDGGVQWRVLHSGVTSALHAIACASARACFVLADTGTLLRTVDGGAHWRAESTGIAYLTAGELSCPTAGACFLGGAGQGGSSAVLLASSDFGGHWQSLPLREALDPVCPTSTVCYLTSAASTQPYRVDGAWRGPRT